MSFKINTNIYALNAHARANEANKDIQTSLERLSSGRRINSAEDDASGLSIANSLRMQAKSLTQAIANTTSANALLRIADNALEESSKILTTIKAKSIQSAEDGQTNKTRLALQKDINRLIESLNNIAKSTIYNGQNLLSGAFANKEFQVGAYSNETVKMSVTASDSDHIGHARVETIDLNDLVTGNRGIALTAAAGNDTIPANGTAYITETVTGTPVTIQETGPLAIGAGETVTVDGSIEQITANTGDLTFIVTDTEDAKVLNDLADPNLTYNGNNEFTLAAGSTLDITTPLDMEINVTTAHADGFDILTGTGTNSVIEVTDSTASGLTFTGASNAGKMELGETIGLTLDAVELHSVEINNTPGTGLGKLTDLINSYSDKVGTRATYTVEITGSEPVQAGVVDNLTINGANIGNITDVKDNDQDGKLQNAINSVTDITGVSAYVDESGRLHLNSVDGRAIQITSDDNNSIMMIGDTTEDVNADLVLEGVIEFGQLYLTSEGAEDVIIEMEINNSIIPESSIEKGTTDDIRNLTSIVDDALIKTREGAMIAMDIVEAAQKTIDAIRSDIGAVQQQLTSTTNNITITSTNVTIAESGIRDVDFALESANFNKANILSQSGTYALSQANSVQENVLTLLR